MNIIRKLFVIILAVTPLAFSQQPAATQAASACTGASSNGTANFLAKFTSACSVVSSILFDNGTKIGLGTSAPVATFDVAPAPLTATTGSLYGMRMFVQYKPTADNTAVNYAGFAGAQSVTGSAFNFKQIYGFGYSADHYGTGTVSYLVGISGAASNHSTGTITTATGLQTSLNNMGGGDITTGYGIQIGAPQNTSGGSIGTYYGLFITAPVSADNNFALYSGGGKNYFGGSVGIGTLTPTANLEVVGDVKITGAGNGITFPDGTTQTTANVGGTGTGTGGPISGVLAGPGLTGGGTSGAVTLSVNQGTVAFQTDLAGEASARAATDTALQTNLTTETTRAQVAEASLLHLTGGSLTGTLNGTSATFTSNVATMGMLSAKGGAAVPAAGTAAASAGFASKQLSLGASSFNSASAAAENETFLWQAEPMGNNTATPGASLNLLFGKNTTPTESGLSIASNGIINFVAGQTFPGSGGPGSSITAITAGAGLTGGGTSGALNIAADPTYFNSHYLSTVGGTVTGPLAGTGATFTGNVVAAQFNGNGSSLTGLNASQLSSGTVPASALAGTYNITAASATTAANATSLGGTAAGNLKTRDIGYMAGCDSCAALATSDSQSDIYFNRSGAMSVVSVTCFSDAGAPVVNLKRNTGGTQTNVLSSNLACSTGGTSSTSFSSSPFLLNLNDRLNLTVVSVDGTAKRATVFINAVLQ